MDTPTVLDISDPRRKIEEYCSDENGYAWPLYDDDPSPYTLSGPDLTAPALLSYPIRGTYLNEMGCKGSPYWVLTKTMEEFLASDTRSEFAGLGNEIISGLIDHRVGETVKGPKDWQALIGCLDAVSACNGLTSVAVTKILHRKRPTLVPINDSRVRNFYGVSHSYARLFVAIHQDLCRPGTVEHLDSLRNGRQTPSGSEMTRLRALDILIWMHEGS